MVWRRDSHIRLMKPQITRREGHGLETQASKLGNPDLGFESSPEERDWKRCWGSEEEQRRRVHPEDLVVPAEWRERGKPTGGTCTVVGQEEAWTADREEQSPSSSRGKGGAASRGRELGGGAEEIHPSGVHRDSDLVAYYLLCIWERKIKQTFPF